MEELAADLERVKSGGVANAVSADRLSAYLFSDRGIYRPGDEIHAGDAALRIAIE